MRLNASVYYGLYRPSPCDLRVYLRSTGVEEGKRSPYEEVLIELGQWYEKKHLAQLGDHVDLSNGNEDERVHRTIEHVRRGDRVLYQPTFRVEEKLGGSPCIVVGQPDFLIREGDEYVIRDVKLSRRITEKDHPEILLQLGLYGWLYEHSFRSRPKRLEVLAGTGSLEPVPFDATRAALAEAERVLSVITATSEPFSPVGWTKCGSCGFSGRCWTSAVERMDVAIVPSVDQGLARALRGDGVSTIGELLERFDEEKLSQVERPWGTRKQRVGKAAAKILRSARALATGKDELLQSPSIPDSPNYVMFDLEGLPPQLDELDKIYLWGVQVFGKDPSPYGGVAAGFGANGDREGWEAFLANARSLLNKYGDIPFVHWHHYEKTHLNKYIERHGDPDGVAGRVRNNLVDLLPITQESIALPLPSYSLKVVEEYVGYKRTQDEYGGQWAMAKFIRATETSNQVERAEIVDSILKYNEEDLAATWAVLEWLRNKGKAAAIQ